jgi:putative ABC transport system substrate-binding protein
MKFIFKKRSCLLFLMLLISIQSFCKDIIIIKTGEISSIEKMVEGFLAICPKKISVNVLDMQGKNRRDDEIINFIQNKKLKGELVHIYTIGTPAAQLVHDNFDDIPLFYSMVNNPIQKGFERIHSHGPSFEPFLNKQINLLKTVLPEIKKLGLVYDPKINGDLIFKMRNQAQLLGLELRTYPVLSTKEVPSSIRQAVNEVEALLIISDLTVINRHSLKYIITMTLEQQIPTIAYTDTLVKAGFLFSLKSNPYNEGQQAARRICYDHNENTDGEIILPLLYDLSINLKTARRLKIVIPKEVLINAKYVIK